MCLLLQLCRQLEDEKPASRFQNHDLVQQANKRKLSFHLKHPHCLTAGLDRQALDHHASQHCENRFHKVRYYNCTNKYINEIT